MLACIYVCNVVFLAFWMAMYVTLSVLYTHFVLIYVHSSCVCVYTGAGQLFAYEVSRDYVQHTIGPYFTSLSSRPMDFSSPLELLTNVVKEVRGSGVVCYVVCKSVYMINIYVKSCLTYRHAYCIGSLVHIHVCIGTHY